FLTKMHLINTKVVQSAQEFSVRLEDRLYVDGYPLISELDAEEVIQDYLKGLQDEGFAVTREMVPKAPENLYKPRQRKSKRKADTQEVIVQPDLLAQKKIKVEQSMAEQRTKRKHEAAVEKIAEESSQKPINLDEDESDSEETSSDEETVAARLRKRPVPVTKGKTPKYVFNEAEIGVGYTKPLRTIHPNPINISSSDNSEELACSSNKSQQKDKQVPSDNPFSELEKHLSPDSLNNHPFTHETAKPTSPPKPKSPPTQPQQENSTKPSSEPQPDISPAPINSPTKQPSPRKSPEPTSEPTSAEQAPELNPNPSTEHVSPERLHTCALCPSEADVVI
ncbi:hypothetical protein L195_g051631, partial [Trifolium pratense]